MSICARLKSLRSAITKTTNTVEESLTHSPIDIDTIECLLNTLKDQSVRVELLNSEYGKALESASDKEVEPELDKMEHYRSLVTQTITNCNRVLTLPKPVHVNADNVVRLPKLTLPTFSGDVLAWCEFEESFLAAVDSTKLAM